MAGDRNATAANPYELPLATSVSGNAGDSGGSTAGGTVPATLALSLGAPASFGAFTPGVAHDHDATTTADVVSTAGDDALRSATRAASHPVSIRLRQSIGADDPLRTGSPSKTLTITLSTTTP